MKTKASLINHFVIGVTVTAGIVALVQAWFGPDTASNIVRACYVAYGGLFVIGSVAYYTKPRIGAAILVISLLSLICVAPLAGFPVWIDASTAARIGIITGCITAAGIVAEPLFDSSGSEKS